MIKPLKKNIFVVLLFLLTLILFYKVVINPEMMINSDVSDLLFLQSYKTLKFDTIREHRTIPLWNPYSPGDSTLVGSMGAGLFYPLNILEFLVNPPLLAGYQFIIHIFLFGLFVYLYMRVLKVKRFSAFIAGIIAMFAGRVITEVYAGHISQIVFVWFPLTFLFFELAVRKKSYFYAILTGASIAMQFSGVHSQYFLYNMLAFSLYFMFRLLVSIKKTGILRGFFKYSKYGLVVICFFLLMSAIQVIPFFETFGLGSRTGGVSWDFATAHSLPPVQTIKFMLPNIFGTPLNHTYWGAPSFWESAGYLGAISLVLCLFALLFKRNKYVFFFSGLAVFSVLFSFGKYTPVFSFFYNFVPLFNLFRVPTRMLTVYTFSMSVLAGFGTEFLVSKIKEKHKLTLKRMVKLLIVAVVLGQIMFLFIFAGEESILSFGKNMVVEKYNDFTLPHEGLASRSLEYYLENVQAVFDGLLKDAAVLLFALTLFTFLLILLLKKKLKLGYFKIFLTIIILFELWSFAMPLIDVVDPDMLYEKNEVLDFIHQDKGIYRVMDINEINLKDWQSINYGIAHIDGFLSVAMGRYIDIMKDIRQRDIFPGDRTIPEGDYALLDLLNTKYIVSEKTTENPNYELVYNGTNQVFNRIEKKLESRENVYIYENKNVLPPAYIVHNAKIITDEKVIAETILHDTEYNPREYIIIEKDIHKPLNNEGDFKEAKIFFYSPNKIIVEADLDTAGFLVLSEIWYPGWKAIEGDKEYEIYRTNYLFRSIHLEKGQHTVEFVFNPLSFRIGLVITFISSIALIVLVIYKIRKK